MKLFPIAAVLSVPILALLASGAPVPPAECPRQEEAAYLGAKSCQKCHFKEYGSWQKTRMARAFDTLKPDAAVEAKTEAGLDPKKDYTREAKCLSCHTTGYGKPGGYPALVEGKAWTPEEKERAARMEGVGCEDCHGPGEKYSPYKKDHKDYKWADIAKLGAVHPVESTCTTCHNAQSPTYRDFKFEEQIGKDTHERVALKVDHGCDHGHREAEKR